MLMPCGRRRIICTFALARKGSTKRCNPEVAINTKEEKASEVLEPNAAMHAMQLAAYFS
jgi:hypothetical protein